jgi:hypothetical protein
MKSPYLSDVLVVGGGTAGIAAAVGASRRGANVTLLERDSVLGGSASTAMVGTICGLSRCGPHAPRPPSFDLPGFATEFALRLAHESGTSLVMNDDGLAYLPYSLPRMAAVSMSFLQAEPGISLLTDTSLQAITRSSSADGFKALITNPSGETREVHALSIIDSSGIALVSQLLGLPAVRSARPQAASLIFELRGLPPQDERVLSLSVRKTLREASIEGSLPERLSYVSIVPGSLANGTALFKLSMSAPEDGLEDTTRGLSSADLKTIVDCVRARGAGYSHIELVSTAPRLGVRDGQRGVGKEELSERAVRLSERHINGIAIGLWPAEMWSSPERPTVTFPERGNSYEIPLGSLCAKDAPGVYFAGRNIAASDYAMASARVIGTCLSTGYAAGRLAAGELQGEPRSATVAAIRTEQVEPLYARAKGETRNFSS